MRKLLLALLILLPAPAWAGVLAVVDGQPITKADVVAANPAARNNPAMQAQVLQGLINRVLLTQAGQREGLEDSPAFRQALAAARADVLAKAALDQWLDRHPIPEKAIRARYDALVAAAPKEQYRLREILVSSRSDAMGLLGDLRHGASFSDLAAGHSIAGNAALGGEAGWVVPSDLPAPVYKRIGAVKPGEVVGPIPIPEGFLIVQLQGRRPAVPLPYDDLRPQLLAQLRNEEANRFVQDLRKGAKIEMDAKGESHAQKS